MATREVRESTISSSNNGAYRAYILYTDGAEAVAATEEFATFDEASAWLAEVGGGKSEPTDAQQTTPREPSIPGVSPEDEDPQPDTEEPAANMTTGSATGEAAPANPDKTPAQTAPEE